MTVAFSSKASPEEPNNKCIELEMSMNRPPLKVWNININKENNI